jgi:ATP-dependent DNA helicase DinG
MNRPSSVWQNLAKLLPDFEKREDQEIMADAVTDAMSAKGHLICEAGTGIGKSFAYLVPAVQFARESTDEKRRLVVSTYTKNLQQQLLKKDIPLLQSAFGKQGFTAALGLGSANYLCLRRLEKVIGTGQIGGYRQSFFGRKDEQIRRIEEWSKRTDTGIRAEFEEKGATDVFGEVARDGDLCIGTKCLHFNRCFFRKSRERLKESDIIIVNHWLFFANIAAGKSILPPYDAVVFDEAHELEDVSTFFAGINVSNYSVDYLLRLVERDVPADGDLVSALKEVSKASKGFFSRMLALTSHSNTLRVINKIGTNLPIKLDDLRKALKDKRKEVTDEQKAAEIKKYMDKCNILKEDISRFAEQKSRDTVYWTEITRYGGRRKRRVSLRSAPISVCEWMQSNVFDPDLPMILTSATLTVDRSFEFVTRRIGLDTREELLLASSLDHSENVTVYVPSQGPMPDDKAYAQFIADQVSELAGVTLPIGGVLILFTSFKLMNEVYDLVRDEIRAPCLKQGEFAKEELIKRFKANPSVLFGVASFWQGIDVPGRALTTVIIPRLPFEVPDSPVTEARIEKIAEEGGIPFVEYQLPQAVMQLKQGFGRLIRKRRDFGVVAVLDMRIVTKGYGRRFLASLPLHKRANSIEHVRTFFDEKVHEEW